jgi:hyperosmotically inducible periplasmic protein
MKRLTLVTACAVLALVAAPAMAQEKPKEKPKETTVVIKDDTTPKVKKGAQVVTDASVTTAVKTRLMKDKAARETSIDVDTKDGVVTIAGTVPTEADKTRIEALVRRTTGVKSVNDNLAVSGVGTSGRTTDKDTKVVIQDDTTPKVKKGTKVVTDASVTTAVKTRLMTDEVARGTSIDVDTNAGVVTISGTVPAEADKARIGQLVAKTTGVKRVVNNLTVK